MNVKTLWTKQRRLAGTAGVQTLDSCSEAKRTTRKVDY
jgi:hypothetical protein